MILSVRGDEKRPVTGLELGTHAYTGKPIVKEEFPSVGALLRDLQEITYPD